MLPAKDLTMRGVSFSPVSVAKGDTLKWSFGMFDLKGDRHLVSYNSLNDASTNEVVVAMRQVKYGFWSPYRDLGDYAYQLNSFSGMIVGRVFPPDFRADWSYRLPTWFEKNYRPLSNILVDEKGRALSAVFGWKCRIPEDPPLWRRYLLKIFIRKNKNVYYVAPWMSPPWQEDSPGWSFRESINAIYIADSSFNVIIQQGREDDKPGEIRGLHILQDCDDMEILLIWLLYGFYRWQD